MSTKHVIAFIIFLLLLVGIARVSGYFGLSEEAEYQNGPVVVNTDAVESNNTAESQSLPVPTVEVVAENLTVPWALVFTAPNRILVSERPGTIREVRDGKVSEPLLTLPVKSEQESGLMGMVADADYATTKRLFACYTYDNNGAMANRVVSLIDKDTSLEVEKTIIENAPAARFHAGCELSIGPDAKLYATFGDATDKSLAQNQDSLAGKIIRLNLDGTIPGDNPFANSPVWSLGHRNPQGLAWHPETGALLETEHGPSGNDGPLGGDEVNEIFKGKNYGWSTVSHEKTSPEFVSPLLVFTPAIAPASAAIYNDSTQTALHGNLFFTALKGTALFRAVLSETSPHTIVSYEKVVELDKVLRAHLGADSNFKIGRMREVIQGPDQALYVTTSNTDGRGTKQDGDDKILRIKF